MGGISESELCEPQFIELTDFQNACMFKFC